MIQLFRVISFMEGVSFLAILFITMPLKYLANLPLANKYIGMLHGLLFIGYLILSCFVKVEKKWGIKTFGIVVLCSLIPMGTFWMDRRYLKGNTSKHTF